MVFICASEASLFAKSLWSEFTCTERERPAGPARLVLPRPAKPARVSVSGSNMTDVTTPEALLPRIASGDPDAVGACLQRYSALVWSLARRFWSDVATIEDVVQEIFIELWRCADRYDPLKASEATFIATIARRRMIDRRRRTSRAPLIEDVMDQDIGVRDESLDQVEISDEARLAREALDQLRPEQRKVILMSVVDGLTHPEIASKTGLPLGTVKSHIRRGLDKAAQLVRSKQQGQVPQ